MVYGDIATLADVFKGYSAADSCCATGYGGGFGEEEVVRHGLGRLESPSAEGQRNLKWYIKQGRLIRYHPGNGEDLGRVVSSKLRS